MLNASSAPPRVLAYERYDPTGSAIEWLRQQELDVELGHALWEMPFRRYTEDELIEKAQGCVALMGASGTRITRRVIESLPALRYIAKFGIGVDSIDIAAASEHGVLVSSTPNDFQIFTVSEHAVALMLALAKRLGTWTPEFMRAGGWRGLTHSTTLRGATVGIVGLGRIGQGVVQRLAGWQARILAYDPFLVDPVPAGVELVDLPELLERADFITLHATPGLESHHLLDAAAFARMKPGAFVVNTSRGSLVDYSALREALVQGRIAGAALDVFDQEPPRPDDPLFTLPNVITTPHVAAWTAEGTRAIGWHAARNLWAMISGEGDADVVNPEARERAAERFGRAPGGWAAGH